MQFKTIQFKINLNSLKYMYLAGRRQQDTKSSFTNYKICEKL